MSYRTYTAIVTVVIMGPDGKMVASETKTAEVNTDMAEFGNDADADLYMREECPTKAAMAAYAVQQQ